MRFTLIAVLSLIKAWEGRVSVCFRMFCAINLYVCAFYPKSLRAIVLLSLHPLCLRA